jgi:Tfp pilus assembly pilus retraction ATPase PilT
MQNMDNSIADMYSKGFIDREEAVIRSNNPAKMSKMLSSDKNMEVVKAGANS